MSQSPQIGSMFPTRFYNMGKGINKTNKGRNPLKSGQCFLLNEKGREKIGGIIKKSQSPQIGSMFPTFLQEKGRQSFAFHVAIPSNRVNVSYTEQKLQK